MAPRNRSVKRRKCEPECVQKALIDMIITNELPFSVVERKEFKERVETAFPGFNVPSSDMIARDCAQRFVDEKVKLKSFIKTINQKVCISLDTWRTSDQSVNYLSVTAHFIDEDWNLHKKVIGFSPIGSDDGEEIGRVVEKCLLDWEISNVLAISAGNASSYDAATSYLGTRLVNPVLDGKCLQLKCLVELSNTMVKEVLKDYEALLTRVRETIRYVIQSPGRIRKFQQRATEDGIVSKSFLTLDCPSRWTSTLEMLQVFEKFEFVFDWFENEDPSYIYELSNTCGVLVYADWGRVRDVIYFLQPFYESNEKILGSHVTSNMFLEEISDITFHLDNWGKTCMRSGEHVFKALEFIWKYDEYWGDVEDSNMLIYIANILDPRRKTHSMEFYFVNHKYRHVCTDERERLWKKKAELVVAAIYDLFNEYARRSGAPHQNANFQTSEYMHYFYHDTSPRGLFHTRKVHFGGNAGRLTEIDIYLNEDGFEDFDGFDILLWWKFNSERYPVLSKMAKDVLAIPISAVALESDINVDGNLLDDFRSSLSPSMVEALVCTQDWIKTSKRQYKVEEGSTKVAGKILKGIYEQMEGATSVCGSNSL